MKNIKCKYQWIRLIVNTHSILPLIKHIHPKFRTEPASLPKRRSRQLSTVYGPSAPRISRLHRNRSGQDYRLPWWWLCLVAWCAPQIGSISTPTLIGPLFGALSRRALIYDRRQVLRCKCFGAADSDVLLFFLSSTYRKSFLWKIDGTMCYWIGGMADVVVVLAELVRGEELTDIPSILLQMLSSKLSSVVGKTFCRKKFTKSLFIRAWSRYVDILN